MIVTPRTSDSTTDSFISYANCTSSGHTETTCFSCVVTLYPSDLNDIKSEDLWLYEAAHIAILIQKARDYAAQWILRIGMQLRFDPPDLMPITRAVRYLKILRCNRFGIGLRIKKDK